MIDRRSHAAPALVLRFSAKAFLLMLIGCPFTTLPVYADTVLFTSGPSTYNQLDPSATGGGWDLCGVNICGVPGVANSFTLSSASTLDAASFVVWANPGDLMADVDWSILSDPVAGPVLASGTAVVTQTFIESNNYGYDIDNETFSIPALVLGPGTYWLELGDNSVSCPITCLSGGANDNDYAWWDENDNPGVSAWDGEIAATNTTGYLTVGNDPADCASSSCSETFTISGTTPEPGTGFLLSCGILAMAVFLRRRVIR